MDTKTTAQIDATLKRFKYLQTEDMHRDHAFDRVEVLFYTDRFSPVRLSIMGPVFSEYRSGPNLCTLSDAVAEMLGSGFVRLISWRSLGWRITTEQKGC